MVARRKILLIGWDAADWKHVTPLLDRGEMPALEQLINRGVMGNLATLQPVVSPMLWNSIATGKTAEKHGVHGFTEADPVRGGARAWTSTSRKCKALWNILNQSGWRCNVIGWWASHPAEPLNGIVVSNAIKAAHRDPAGRWHVPAGCVHPADLAETLAQFRMSPREVSAEHILPFIPRAAEIDQAVDSRLNTFATVFSDAVTMQALATEVMEAGEWDFTAVYFDAVDHLCHSFMAYHPPRLPWVSEHDFDLYQNVINGTYRFHDMMLERLVELAGPEAVILLCSDHGFQSGSLRPRGTPREPAGPTFAHRDLGLLVLAGPGVKMDERIYGASLLDITPTLLTLAGLPVGADMDGKPLVEALDDPTAPARIPSWDDVPGDDGRHPPGFEMATDAADSEQADELVRQFAALGYVEDHTRDRSAAALSATLEANYNLAQVHLSGGRPNEAIALLESLLAQRPWENRFIHQLAHAYARAGWFRQAGALLAAGYPEGGGDPPPVVRLLQAKACLGQGDEAGTLHFLALAEACLPEFPALLVEKGLLLFDMRRWDEAEAAFRATIDLDPENAAAFQGLSSVLIRRRRNEEAAHAALDALRLLYQQPIAHFNLGIALARMGDVPRARGAFLKVAQMRPGMVEVHRWLAALGDGDDGASPFLAAAHRTEARRLSLQRAGRTASQLARAQQTFPLPDLPPPHERQQVIDRERPAAAPAAPPSKPSGRLFTIVSGLPRSGTSLMMQMLDAGGLMPQTDGERAADDDNPEGYYEWEPVKRLAREPELLDADGLDRRALKVISMLLPTLPRQHSYRVIFMSRPAAEIARSQKKMIERRQSTGMAGSLDDIIAALTRHRNAVRQFLAKRPGLEVLEVDFTALIADPRPVSDALATFLGPDLLPHPERMAAVVRPELHRQKG